MFLISYNFNQTEVWNTGKQFNATSSTHGVFLRNRLDLERTSVTSFRVQFEKVGRELLRGGKRR